MLTREWDHQRWHTGFPWGLSWGQVASSMCPVCFIPLAAACFVYLTVLNQPVHEPHCSIVSYSAASAPASSTDLGWLRAVAHTRIAAPSHATIASIIHAGAVPAPFSQTTLCVGGPAPLPRSLCCLECYDSHFAKLTIIVQTLAAAQTSTVSNAQAPNWNYSSAH